MGLMTLADFREDLQSALGERGYANARLDRWINFGYLDLTGAVEFEVLADDEEIDTANGQNYIATPDNALIVTAVRDNDNDNILAWIPKTEYLRRLQATSGDPTHWTRHKDTILLHPVPDAVIALGVYTIEPPAILALVSDTTVLPDTWDPAVFQLSVHHALLATADEQRAVAWLSRAIAYIGSRITESDYHGSREGLGASIPRGMEALQARLEQLQGAS
jgi:hypothetical protein